MKIKLGKDALVLSILTLVTVLVWMAFDIYRALIRTEVPHVLKTQIAPLDPTISTIVLDDLESRISYPTERLNQITETIIVPEEVEVSSPIEETTSQPSTESAILE